MDSDDVHRRWTARSGAYSPEYYAYYGPNETSELLRETIARHADADAEILELGCSSGRHLAHLYDHGYENVSGVEINADAFDVMDEQYPELAAGGTFHHGAIEDVVPEFDEDAFDVVYSVETLQHLHPDAEWVFAELARVTGTLLVTVENEGHDGDGGDDSGENGADGDDSVGGGSDSDDERGANGADRGEDGETPAVNYIEDDFPLYYRDWNDIFTDVGLTEVASESLDRDTFRAFTPA
ncbi:Methyltransferase domain-containing protein [Halogeometricum rufum]|uniref:Methyltransferase domain-containing protein n=1 Tax=Halogeometricum rufum TaxID=553469 RepID=A0A1I6J980_9EURY|nr:class I SAM-dependent methyltransferase [Halogeometricum rufum]SFR75546.1 Methyltransferase domain-containing protein [Halogeometricum rufum]